MATSTSEESMMPIWLDDSHLDAAWIRRHTLLPCLSCSVEDISNETRRGEKVSEGGTLLLNIELEGDSPSNKQSTAKFKKTLVLKQIPQSKMTLSEQLGLAREALFYEQMAPDLNTNERIIPEILYAWGDMKTGAKVLLMEDLSEDFLDSGVFFGPGNPNNWNRNLENLVKKAGPNPPSARDVAAVTFRAMAKVHATFWQREDLLDAKYQWLRGHQWLCGEGRESWEASQQVIKNSWQGYLEREAQGRPSLQWDPLVRSAVETAIAGISWDAHQKRLHRAGQWTLVHGDFWPGNCMLRKKATEIRLLDWEMVGLGSGPQDLGQYVLSNMDPTERRVCERELVEVYYKELKNCGVSNADFDYCWSEYKLGGLERWIWFLVYFIGDDVDMLDWAQFFHGQVSSFMHDHNITINDIIQPRP